MQPDVIAFPRRQGVFLAAVLAEELRPGKAPLLSVLAEDGARFRFPADGVIARVPATGAPEAAADLCAWLRRRRDGLQPFEAWPALHGRLEDGALVDTETLADAAGLSGVDGVLQLALGAQGASPWLCREDGGWRVVPIHEVLLTLFDHHRERWNAAGDEDLLAWWQTGDPVPAAWPSGALAAAAIQAESARWISEPDYEPDRPTAAAAALAALVDATLSASPSDDGRGRELARRTGLFDDPDRLLEALVARGALAADADAARHRAQLAGGFDEAAVAEVATLVAAPSAAGGREDLCDLFTVAVDDPDTREVDDALSIRRIGAGLELYVHIADVAGDVPAGGALDRSVRARGASLYLPGDSELLFPPSLVVERLSLSLDGPRAAVTGVFRTTADGGLELVRFTRSLVVLDRRVGYDETRDVAALAATGEDADALVRTAGDLLARRVQAGARVLRLPGFKVTATPQGMRLSTRLQDTPGDLIVSEAMVLNNAAAAHAMAAAGVPALFRWQCPFVPAGRAIPTTDDPLYDLLVRRTFGHGGVDVEAKPHAGVGAAEYAQCTSPMRRYADLVNQRQLLAAVDGVTPPHDRDELTALAPLLLERERCVRRASDGRTQRIVAGLFAQRIGEPVRGILSRSPKRGLGSVWVPELCRELPLRAEKGWRGPPVGTEAEWRVAAAFPLRGRIELAPA